MHGPTHGRGIRRDEKHIYGLTTRIHLEVWLLPTISLFSGQILQETTEKTQSISFLAVVFYSLIFFTVGIHR